MIDAFDIVGLPEAERHLDQIAHRVHTVGAGMAELTPYLEHSEESLFASYGGKYVRSGALRASLTQATANGAIREAHGATFVFGSSIAYARFQGTTGQGHHARPSAILRAPAGAAQLAARIGARYIVEGLTGAESG